MRKPVSHQYWILTYIIPGFQNVDTLDMKDEEGNKTVIGYRHDVGKNAVEMGQEDSFHHVRALSGEELKVNDSHIIMTMN